MAAVKLRHAHGCTRCRGRYEDGCSDPHGNALCQPCQGRSGWALLANNRAPKDCCRVHCRPTTKHDLALYQLSKGCSWWICRVCARTHPFDPQGVTP